MLTPARHRTPEPTRGDRLTWLAAALVAIAVTAVGVTIRRTKGELGTATPPFVIGLGVRVDALGLLVAVVVLAALAFALPRLVDVRLPGPAVALALLGAAIAAGLALNLSRYGTDGWTRPFVLGPRSSGEGANEYLPGLPTLHYGVRFYLDRFAEIVPSQSVNVAGHPPGPLLVMHALGITTPGGLAALCVVAGSACAPLAQRLGTTLHDAQTGRVAGVLCALSPVALLYGVSSYDYVFAACGAVAACLLVARSPWLKLAGTLAVALAALMSWALLGVAAWAVLVVWQRDGLRSAVVLALGCGAALLAVDGLLAAIYGYDPIGTLKATEQVYRDSISTRRPWWFWVLGSPVAWGVMLGLPIAALVLRAVRARDHAAVALAAIVVVAAVGGFTKAETERIWLAWVPLACVAAAPYVRRDRLGLICAALAAQALLVGLIADTVW